MEYIDILSPGVKKSLDMMKNTDKRPQKVKSPEDSAKNIHRYKYYETQRRYYLHIIPFLTNEEMCDFFDIKPNTLDHWVSKGWIGYSQPTNKRIFLRRDIEEFIKRNRMEVDHE